MRGFGQWKSFISREFVRIKMADDRNKNSPQNVTKIGSYHVGKTIGKGNFAIVKLAEQELCKAKVAIKMIDKSQLEPDNLLKVMREVSIMKQTNHTNIIRLYEVMETERYLYLVTEFASKGEIFDLLIKNGRLHENEARKMFRQIISAMEYLHQKRIVHRDLKAENLLLDENSRIKLADFGFSNMFDVGAKLKTWCGSPPYAAPELFEGKEYYGPAADIWSMGVVLYVLVCGALPFDGRTLPDLKQRVLTGKFRIPFFMSSDCEHLIRHMLVVDVNKRYTMNQIKQHKWIIQGEPYDFLVEEDEFCFAQQHGSGNENGNVVYNEFVIKQMTALGEDEQKIIDCLQRRTFDHTYGLYHILLDQTLRLQRQSSIASRSSDGEDDFQHLESEKLNSKQNSPDLNQFSSFEPRQQQQELTIEEGEPDPNEIARYLSRTNRRETIAVSHIKPHPHAISYHNPLDIQTQGIPSINIHASPSPPLLSDTTSRLEYKEQYLPRPAVLQVRPQFDRRASDGSATLHDSIAQFNMLRNNKKKSTENVTQKSFEKGLNVIESDDESESDEPDKDEVKSYMLNRGNRQRHTFNCILESTEEAEENNLESLKMFHHSLHRPRSRPSMTKKLERENRSPLPYLPVSPESRRNLTNERRQSDGCLSVHLYNEKKKDESSNELSQVLSESKKLQDQFLGSNNEAGPRFPSNNRRISGHSHVPRETPFRYSYPGPQHEDVHQLDSDLSLNDPHLAMLHQKQEAQKQNLLVRFLVERKFLEKRMEEERRELIRRASEGAPRLENSIAEFLATREEPKLPPTSSSTELHSEMQKLNLQVSPGIPGLESPISPLAHDSIPLFDEALPHNNPPHSIVQGEGSMLPSPRTMDVDEHGSAYRFASPQSLFNNMSGNPRQMQRRGNTFSWSPNRPSTTFTPGGHHAPEIQSPLLHNNGSILWGNSAQNEGNSNEDHSHNPHNKHEPLSASLSVDITSSLNIAGVVGAVKTCLESKEVDYSQSDTYFSIFKDGIQIEMDIYPLAKGSAVNGIKIRRVGGDKWAYKKLRDDILSGLHL